MANSKRLDLKPILPFLPPEPGLRAHLFRVSALASRAAQFNGYSEESVQDVGWAGMLHHLPMGSPDTQPSAAEAALPIKLVQDLGLDSVPGFAPLPERASAIVRRFRGTGDAPDQDTAAAASLLESANLFDEQMENLPYEDLTAERAVTELLRSGVIARPFQDAIDSFRIITHQDLSSVLARLKPVSSSTVIEGGNGTQEFELAMRRILESGRDDSLWLHALDLASNLSQVAGESARLNRLQAFVAGMVHDIGRLAYRDSSAGLEVNRWQSLGFPVTYAEFLVSGTDHAALGAELLVTWGYADLIAEGVEYHHRPELSSSVLAAAIYAYEDFDELLPSCARDHLAAKRMDLTAVRHLGAAG